ncbi:hypothetical protein PHYPSEUDO_001963 [Phytophthora pseudosyringae]|uniref:Uncharacterized protein n=1 Tax=Phytophthora pseudosyringae TaxID=221518 RepID=A0A8T1VUV5_9STRA|nr:hypothetical protein PHYPSEUDO_001963 [Phytophthora pseudosyringae]
MPSREFPAPPDLSELLKFFESDEGKARVSRQHGASRGTTQRLRQHLSQPKCSSSENHQTATLKVWRTPPTVKPATAENRHLPQSSTTNREHTLARDEKTSTTTQGWNASTQLPPAPATTLRHQLLCRTYQPPAPVYVVPSEASELLDRLAKGTISSRSKLKTNSTRGGQNCSAGGDDRSSSAVRLTSPADTRGRDAIQTLLFYRKEVEKRRHLDTRSEE